MIRGQRVAHLFAVGAQILASLLLAVPLLQNGHAVQRGAGLALDLLQLHRRRSLDGVEHGLGGARSGRSPPRCAVDRAVVGCSSGWQSWWQLVALGRGPATERSPPAAQRLVRGRGRGGGSIWKRVGLGAISYGYSGNN